ncbi:MAG: hypothetical protein Q3971_04920 [Moraxella sp.]|nr:hypothetical protein [Moraxella sp.]
MSQIQTLVDTLTAYKSLSHHTSPALKQTLIAIQHWQKQRIKHTNHALFSDDKTAPLANYLIDRIYGDDEFDVLADQLLTAGHNALNGSGKLEKLIPTNALGAGVLGVQCAVQTVELDLALAQICQDEHPHQPIDDTLMTTLYQKANAKDARTAQIYAIADVCQQSDKYFNSFILQNAFKLAKKMAYNNGYQPLYDFINDGLIAMKPLKNIDDFVAPFMTNELAIINQIHANR